MKLYGLTVTASNELPLYKHLWDCVGASQACKLVLDFFSFVCIANSLFDPSNLTSKVQGTG